MNYPESNNMLALFESLMPPDSGDIAMQIAGDFKKRRIEKNLTRRDIAERSGVSISNIARFEQKGLISLGNLIEIAIVLNYTSEIKSVFSQPKYSTMEELTQIRRNTGKKKAYHTPSKS